MSAPDAAVPLDELLAHRAWVRALSVALTRDENDADDIEQQTWLAAVRSPPATDESPRGWLGTVARNAARKRGRSAGRRRRRECTAARSESAAGSDPAELATRADLHAKVASAVVELSEPYRQTLLLRYFEGLSVAEVAARMAAPLETTRARLRRGREQLRGRLERDVGRGRPLAVALLPLLDRGSLAASGTTAGAAAGGMAMASKIALGAAAGLILVAGIWWGTQDDDGPVVDEVTDTATVEDERVPVDSPTPAEDPTPPRPERARVRAPAPQDLDDVPEPVSEEGETQKTVEERMHTPIESMQLQGEQLAVALSELSDVTGIPIHIDSRREKDIENVPVHMQLEGLPAGMVLQTLARISGMNMVVEEDRVVLHDDGDVWSAGLPTVVIEPKSRDPDAPQTIAVRGTVRAPDGGLIEGAEIRHGNAVVGATDVNGEFVVDVPRPFSFVLARSPGAQDSSFVRVNGEPGDEVEADLVLGPPSGTAVVRVGSSSGEAPKFAQVRFRWVIPGGRDGVERPRSTQASGMSRDGETLTFGWLPPGEIEMTVSARGHVREQRVVTIDEGASADVDVELRRVDVADRLRDETIYFDVTDEPARRLLARIRMQKALDVTFAEGTPAEVFDARVSLKVSNDSIENALRALCQSLPGSVTWKIQGDVVVLFRQ